MRLTLLTTIIISLLLSCDTLDDKIKIVNKTSKKISHDVSFEHNDTVFNHFLTYIDESILPKDTFPVMMFGENSTVKNLRNSKSKKIIFNFYYTDTINVYRKKYLSMYKYYCDKGGFKHLELDERQMDSCKWTINVFDSIPSIQAMDK